MTRWAVLAVCAAGACGGGPRTATSPTPLPAAGGNVSASGTATSPDARIAYSLKQPVAYEVSRYDSIAFQNIGSGAPQVTGRRARLLVTPDGGKVQVSLDSVVGVLGQRLAPSALDSARGARVEVRMNQDGPSGDLRLSPKTVLVGQLGSVVRLLFPQLPKNGARAGDAWGDSTSYPVHLDAFEATETAARESRASKGTAGGVRVEGIERLTRKGSATQGGRAMTLSGSGVRQVTYDLAPEGWVSFLIARDSLDLRVIVPDSPDPIPVRWRSTIVARLRGTPPD